MSQTVERPGSVPRDLIHDLIDRHGAMRVLAALIAAMLRARIRKTRPPDAMRRLNAHLLRDIGLDP